MAFLPKRTGHYRNVIWSGLDYAAVPIGMLIATPFLIAHLGLGQFGVWVLINALVGMGSMAGLGLGDTTVKYVSQLLSAGDKQGSSAILRTTLSLSLLSGAGMGLFFILFSASIASAFRITGIPHIETVLVLASCILLLRLIEVVYVGALRGSARYDLAGAVTVLTRLGNIAALVILASTGRDLWQILPATVASLGLSIVGLFLLCSWCLGRSYPGFSIVAFKKIWRFSSWSWLQSVAGSVYANIDKLIVSAVLGPASLAVYGVCIQLAQNIHSGLAALGHSLFPRISAIVADQAISEEDREISLRRLYLSATHTLSVAAILLSSFIAVFSKEILQVWVGESIAAQGHLLLSLLAISYGWFSATGTVSYYTLNGFGMARKQAAISVGSGLIFAISSIVFVPWIGLVGAAIARFPGNIFALFIRMFVVQPIIRNVGALVAFDFIRLSLLSIAALYLIKQLFTLVLGSQVFVEYEILIAAAAIFMTLYFPLMKLERFIGARAGGN